MSKTTVSKRPRVVIVGGGFGGLAAAKACDLFQSRLRCSTGAIITCSTAAVHQVATGVLSPANIASPLRGILRHQQNCRVLMGEVLDFDLAGKRVIVAKASLWNSIG